MTIALRALLIAGSLCFSVFTIRKIRRSSIEIGDSIFWILLSVILLLISLFPDLVFASVRVFGIQSPANGVFAFIVSLLTYKCFSLSVKVSELSQKLRALTGFVSAQNALRDAHAAATEEETDA